MSADNNTVLIAMAIHDTEENGRTEYTKATLEGLKWTPHPRWLVDNASCKETKEHIEFFSNWYPKVHVITNATNIGTAEAVNLAWRHRKPGQHCVKMDNDVLISDPEWVERMREVLERDPSIGIVGLKRKDLMETPDSPEPHYKSTLRMLPHEKGQSWVVVEEANHIMGTVQMYSSALLDRIGYLVQPGLYGFDDSLASFRSRLAGFRNVFLPHIRIEHIDRADTAYSSWKHTHAGDYMRTYNDMCSEYRKGKDVYYSPFL